MKISKEGRGRCLDPEVLSQTLNQEIKLDVGNTYQTAFWPEIQTQDLTSTMKAHPICYTVTSQGKKRSYRKDRK